MKFLIADDNATNRLVLAAMLKKEGHEVVAAEDGKEAVEAFAREQPDMIIMDVMMPVMSGYEATAQIKAQCGDRFVPVIFLTAITDEAGLAECIKQGGDDFFIKPFNRTILKSKIDALTRIRNLYALAQRQYAELAAHQDRIAQEQALARSIFETILSGGCLRDSCLQYRQSPAAVLNGDFLLAARTPSGVLHVLLGDMTGHGLSAAVGALPLANVFYSMTNRGHNLPSIAAEMNRKAKSLLPPGMFCAAALAEWDHSLRKLGIWNGGIPDLLLATPGQGVTYRFPSRHLALGILSDGAVDTMIETIEVPPDSRLYLYSDGFIEHENSAGEPFGQERLEACLTAESDLTQAFGCIEMARQLFSKGQVAHDDATILEIHLSKPAAALPPSTARAACHAQAVLPWDIVIELSGAALSRVDPLPQVTRLLNDFPDLAGHRDAIFTILAELLGNAVDHGLLGLDSKMRATPEGFAEYYMIRDKRMRAIAQGYVRVHLSVQAAGATGGRFTIRIEDSGPGFDWQAALMALDKNRGYSGFGLPLLKSLCEEIRFEGIGNIVHAVYAWS